MDRRYIMTQAEADAKVAKGAALMDVTKPDWRKTTNLLRLDMSDSCDCVVGQNFEDYSEGARLLFQADHNDNWPTSEYGFDLEPYWAYSRESDDPIGNRIYDWKLLQTAWMKELSKEVAQ